MHRADEQENEIDAAAAAWVTKLDAAQGNGAVQADFETWLTSDSRHQGAYLRAFAAWSALDRLQILPAGDFPAPPRVATRRYILAGSAAAAAAAAVAGVSLFFPRPQEFFTPIGEIRRVPLDDGSLVALNTNSLLDIEIKANLRKLTLDRGEAWFAVAKDSKRPFVVLSGPVRVRAKGTAFSVRRRDDGVDVLVTEGIVETWTDDRLGQKASVAAGSKVFVSNVAGPSEVVRAPEEISRALAWRDGEIILDGQTLAAAAAEFNRYNTRRLTVDPLLAEKRLVGLFHTNEPDAFARAAAATLGVGVVANGKEIHIAPKTPS